MKLVFFLFVSCSECVVSAGIFRIFGSEVAELPLVATDTNFQGQVSNKHNQLCFDRRKVHIKKEEGIFRGTSNRCIRALRGCWGI